MRETEDVTNTASTVAGEGTFRTIILSAAETLFPGYFALTMATGVVSIASALLDMRGIAWALLIINWIAYPSLWGLTIVRVAAFRRQLAGDISDHQRAPGFFTLVAGTCVFGTQNMIVADARIVATLLWWFGLGLWLVVMYGFFTAVTIRARKPSLAAGINGAWLIGAVATQSIVVLRGALDAGSTPPEPIQFIVLMMFMIGSMLYLAIIPLIFYRLTFVRLSTRDFSPPYWINMGAVAISTLAGATLILRTEHWPLIKPFLPFVTGFTMFFWSVATWWIPFLLTLMAWRYLWKKDRLAYEPALWGMVFPLGMYTTSTLQLSRAMDLEFLKVVPQIFIWVALAAWLATMTGLLFYIYRSAVSIRARVLAGR